MGTLVRGSVEEKSGLLGEGAQMWSGSCVGVVGEDRDGGAAPMGKVSKVREDRV